MIHATFSRCGSRRFTYGDQVREIDVKNDVLEILEKDFAGLRCDEPAVSPSFRGGQTAADNALGTLNISSYARKRSQVQPLSHRGASRLSPYIRHNLISLRDVWDAVEHNAEDDRTKYRDELLWQEFARHAYARLGMRLHSNLRFESPRQFSPPTGFQPGMACIDAVVEELETDGWLVNQTRMWVASHWAIRQGMNWQAGQEYLYKHLLDGSRAANILGWQWTVGAGTGKPYGFARWQVNKRAPELCGSCPLNNNCPIEQFPETETPASISPEEFLLARDHNTDATRGPHKVVRRTLPEWVLLTKDSLGDEDPALTANPDLPVAYVFDQEGLAKLQLSSKRLGFYIETLQDLAQRRDVSVFIGSQREFAENHAVSVTYAPVPAFKKIADVAAEVHPWPWLVEPHGGSIKSYSAWRNKVKLK